MLKGAFTIVGVVFVFCVVVIWTIVIRKKKTPEEMNPHIKVFNEYQSDILDNGYAVVFHSKPQHLDKKESLIYQVNASVQDVKFDEANPLSKVDHALLWITNIRLLMERENDEDNEKISAFNLELITEFEFDLGDIQQNFLFNYCGQYFKFMTTDIYFIALLELKILKSRNNI